MLLESHVDDYSNRKKNNCIVAIIAARKTQRRMRYAVNNGQP